MRTDLSVERSSAGFTLIEVLVAMLILAIGFLGLEALGIGAAKSVAMANRQSQYAKVTSDSLESAMHQLRAGTIPSNFCIDLPRGDRLSRRVTMPAAEPWIAAVAVRAIPAAAAAGVPRDPFEISSSVYLPTIIPGSANGSPCS